MAHIEGSGDTGSSETGEQGKTENPTGEPKPTEKKTETAGEIQSKEADPTPAPTGKTLTQDEVNALVGKTRTESRDKAVASLLEELGIPDKDALGTLVKESEERRQANLSETEKLNERILELEGSTKEGKQTSKQLKAYEAAMQANVEIQIKELSIPDHIAALLEPMTALDKLSYLTENAKHFAKPAPANTNAGNKGTSNTTTSDEDRKKAVKARYGIRN